MGALARVPVDAFASSEAHVKREEPETLGFVAEYLYLTLSGILRLMDKILHDLKDPKLWELWYIPDNG